MPRHDPPIKAPDLSRPSGAIQLDVQEIQQLAIDIFETLNDHDLDAWSQYVSEDYHGDAPGAPRHMTREQAIVYQQNYITAFPDLMFDFERLLGQGDLVTLEWKATGTHNGPLRSPTGGTIPPTNKQATVFGSTTFRFENRKVKHAWYYWDMATLLAQLGLMPGMSAGEGVARRAIVHVEIPAADREALADFYNGLFGWDFEHMPAPMNYTTFRSGSVGGGFTDVGEMYEPGDVLLYIESDDIEDDLRRIESMGGQTMMPSTEIPGVGWFAIFTDPTGNKLALLRAMME